MARETYRRVRTMIALRVLIGATLLLGTAFPLYLSQRTELAMELFRFVAVLLTLSLIYAVLLDRVRHLLFFAYIQIVIDVFLETLVIAQTGGIESPFSILYILTIISANIVLMGQSSFLIAQLSAILYGWLVISERWDLIRFRRLASEAPTTRMNLPSSYVAYTVGITLFGFFLVALLSSYVSERLRRTDALLVRRLDDLSDLRRMNENIVQSMASGLLITTPGGEITFINQAAIEILAIDGRRAGSLLHVIDLLPVTIWNETRKQLGSVEEGPLVEAEIPHEMDGRTLHLGITSSPLRSRRGSLRGVMFVLEDRTERIELEAQRRKAETLGGMARLSAALAHEIRNPLASLSGSIELLQNTLNLQETEDRLMSIVLRESERLNQLIDDFLRYARPKPPELKTVDVLGLLRDTGELIRHHPRTGQGVRVQWDLPSGRLPALVDPVQMKQVLWNLSLNAIEAMPEGGELRIEASRGPTLAQRTVPSGVHVVISPPEIPERMMVRMRFRDTGIGMSEDELSQIFTPFTSFKEQGTGIGLAIAYRIVENHGGFFRVESAPGKGSVFDVHVPAVVELPPVEPSGGEV